MQNTKHVISLRFCRSFCFQSKLLQLLLLRIWAVHCVKNQTNRCLFRIMCERNKFIPSSSDHQRSIRRGEAKIKWQKIYAVAMISENQIRNSGDHMSPRHATKTQFMGILVHLPYFVFPCAFRAQFSFHLQKNNSMIVFIRFDYNINQ